MKIESLVLVRRSEKTILVDYGVRDRLSANRGTFGVLVEPSRQGWIHVSALNPIGVEVGTSEHIEPSGAIPAMVDNFEANVCEPSGSACGAGAEFESVILGGSGRQCSETLSLIHILFHLNLRTRQRTLGYRKTTKSP